MAQAEKAWKPDWRVECTFKKKITSYMTDKAIELALQGLEEYTQLPFSEAKDLLLSSSFCDDSISSDDGAWKLRRDLRGSEAWLRWLGFESPYLVTDRADQRKHLAYIDSWLYWRRDNSSRDHVEVNASYYPSTGEIYFSTSMLRDKLSFAAHELFHGIQRGSTESIPFWFYAAQPWIGEGTARATESYWASKINVAEQWSIETRRFDIPLDRDIDGYGTALFWRDVGRQLRSREGIGYLPAVFERIDIGPTSETGIDAVDAALKQKFSTLGGEEGGLYRAYPEFVRYKLDNPYMIESWFGVSNDGGSYKELIELALSEGEDPVEHVLDDQVMRIASRGYLLVLDVPEGMQAGLRIELEGSNEVRNDSLHLIVDDRRLNRHASADYPNRRRNLFLEPIKGKNKKQQFFVRVANVARNIEDNSLVPYKLRFTLTEFKLCDSDVMMSTIHPDAHRRLSSGMGGQRPLLPAKEYKTLFEEEPGLHPAQGKLSLSGLVTDGGTACAEPLGSNPTLGLYADDGVAERRIVEALEKTFSKAKPDIRQMLESMAEASGDDSLSALQNVIPRMMDDKGARVAGGAVLETMDPDGDTVISVYSPNAMSWQNGPPSLPISPGWQLFKHRNFDKWKENSGAQITFKIPGVSPSQLRQGVTYEAEMVQTASAEGTVLYSRWSGTEIVENCRGIRADLLKGTTEQLTAERLNGVVIIDGVNGAAVDGRFVLQGAARLEKTKFKISKFGGCRSMVPKVDIDKGDIIIEGKFSAPAIIDSQRPGRAVSLTWAPERVEEDDYRVAVLPAFFPPPIDGLEDSDRGLPWWLLLLLLFGLLDSDGDIDEIKKKLGCVGSDCEKPTPKPEPCVGPNCDKPEPKPCVGRDCIEPDEECIGIECIEPKKKYIPDPCKFIPCGPFPDPTFKPVPITGPDFSPGGRPGDTTPGAPGTPGSDTATTPAPVSPGVDPDDVARYIDDQDGQWLLSFIESSTTNSDLESGAQRVDEARSRQAWALRVTGESHQVRISIAPEDVIACEMPGMLGTMLVSGTTLEADVDLRLSANFMEADLRLTNRDGASSIAMRAGGASGGSVETSFGDSGGLRVEVSGGHFDFSSEGVEVDCAGVADFVATLSGVP